MMNREQVEAYMDALLGMGPTMCRLAPVPRRQFFVEQRDTQPLHIRREMYNHGLKGTFGLTNAHRENISVALKAAWAKRKAEQTPNHLGEPK
jgi:hypothetical protein